MELTFVKLAGKWYVDLPSWQGSVEDLEMVNGADDLLEALSLRLDRKRITFTIWTEKPDVPCGSIIKTNEDLEGATYQVHNCNYYKDTVWLCNVTKFVFKGRHPKEIYFKVR